MSAERYSLLTFFVAIFSIYVAQSAIHSLTGEYQLHQISHDEFRMHILEKALKNNEKGLGGAPDRDFVQKRNEAFHTIQQNIQLYFLEAAMENFFEEVTTCANETYNSFTKQERNAFGNHTCKKCDLHKLENLLEVYLTVLEKYPDLHKDTNLENHLITHFDKAKEFVRRKLAKFKSDLAKVKNDAYFNTRQEYHEKKEKVIGMMAILYKWCDLLMKGSQDDGIKKDLFKQLTREKRFWLLKELRTEY
ncbi:hypothetical protein CBL_02600 [Carabus blaptoides fortunei]